MTLRLAKIALAAALAACMLAACSDRGSSKNLVFDDSNLFPVHRMAGYDRVSAAAPSPPPILGFDAARAAPANAQTKLAVTHAYTLAMPSRDVEAVQRRDLDECARLGCTVLSTTLQYAYGDQVVARTSLRISPQGFDAFTKVLAAWPAHIVSHSQTADDKTLPLLDVEKRLAAKIALRDRLEAMLKDPATKTTADLLAIEKELSQIQSDIESATAQRDYLRTITDTVRVDIAYDGLVAEVAGLEFAPLKRALGDFGATVLNSLATLIYLTAALLPWLPVFVGFGWLVRRGLRRWRARRAQALNRA
jgi:hypothetical protein